ncbi:MAG TPA: hypothetical protein VGU02_08050 [Gaiellaceae bacterium]|nr:hypothetical protein [Gaiellaceae bacterium]
MSGYATAHIDGITSQRGPGWWSPIRHYFGIESFGVNGYRGASGAMLVPEHDEAESGAPELYFVANGHAEFTVGDEKVDGPAGTFVWVHDPRLRRSSNAIADETFVLAIGAGAAGQTYAPTGWETLAGES